MRGRIKSVLDAFLGTFTSRYSDFDGYWLFGFLVADLDRRTIDLLGVSAADDVRAPWDFASALARARFRDQADKQRVPLEAIRSAEMEVAKLPGVAEALINTERWAGSNVQCTVRATTPDGRAVERTRRVFVAPHSNRESRRLPENWLRI
jgi:hypothetical protein